MNDTEVVEPLQLPKDVQQVFMALIEQKKKADQPSEKESISINTAFKEMVKEIQKDLEEEEYQADIGGSSAFRSSSVTDAASPNSLKESKK